MDPSHPFDPGTCSTVHVVSRMLSVCFYYGTLEIGEIGGAADLECTPVTSDYYLTATPNVASEES